MVKYYGTMQRCQHLMRPNRSRGSKGGGGCHVGEDPLKPKKICKYQASVCMFTVQYYSKFVTNWTCLTTCKVLAQEIHMCNIKALSLLVRKLWPSLKFLKRMSNFKVKVMRSKIMGLCEKSCYKEYTYMCIYNMKALSLTVKKLWPRLKFLFTPQTRTRTVGLWH